MRNKKKPKFQSPEVYNHESEYIKSTSLKEKIYIWVIFSLAIIFLLFALLSI
jgi:hypothetical protein